ncbi:MAG: ABC transporter ATP-binding protein/permease [Thermoflexales bacterium]|nr:ABC transporter ATP-binding protein/permease [Thermoflexales bacterium]MDW8351729.1 ABC transporter ATP-binding protein [Anaerolineae bacterium]
MFKASDTTWRLMRYVKPYRLMIAVAAVLFIVSTGLNLVFPLVSGQLVNAVTGTSVGLTVGQIIGILIAVFVARALVDIVSQSLIAEAGESVTRDLRQAVYAHLQHLDLGFFAGRRTGELTSRLSSDVTVVRVALVNNVATLLSSVLTVVGSAALVVTINWRLTGIVLLIFPLATIIARLYSRSLRPLATKAQDCLADTNAIAEEAISGVRVVKAFGREPYEIQRFNQASQAVFRDSLRLARIRATFGPLIGLMFFFALVGVLWFGSQEVSAGRLRPGDLVAFLLYGAVIAGGISGLANIFTQFQEAIGATRRLFEILDTQPKVRDAPGARDIGDVRGRITFDRVSFAYEDGREALSDVSLDIAPGEILALVGPSGAGKSTLFNLIPRFYDPTQGAVRLDGVDLRELTLASLRATIAIVPQDTQLFSGSVRENILYGDLNASEEAMIAAAKAANAHDFILALPKGYDTLVGERGVKLSGGQRQRVAIARAILKNPRILLLDEATSALDSESEGLVQEALGRLMRGRTTIIIAHRLSTVQVAHRIAVLDKGRLVELGTHDELMARHGLYYKLYSLQFEIGEFDGELAHAAEDERLSDDGRAPRSRRRGFSPFSLLDAGAP